LQTELGDFTYLLNFLNRKWKEAQITTEQTAFILVIFHIFCSSSRCWKTVNQ